MYSLKSGVKIKYAERMQGLREVRSPEGGESTVKQGVFDVWRITVKEYIFDLINYRI